MIEQPLPDMPAGPSPEDLVFIGLRKRYLELSAKIAQYEEERENIKVNFRRLGAGAHPIGDGKATVSPQRRFDPDIAEKVLTEINPDLLIACSKSVVDSGLVKLMLGDLVYDRCKKNVGEDKVQIA